MIPKQPLMAQFKINSDTASNSGHITSNSSEKLMIIDGYIRMILLPLFSSNILIPKEINNIIYIYLKRCYSLMLSLEFEGNLSHVLCDYLSENHTKIGRIFSPFSINFNKKCIHYDNLNYYKCFYEAMFQQNDKGWYYAEQNLLNRPRAATCFTNSLSHSVSPHSYDTPTIFHVGGHEDDYTPMRLFGYQLPKPYKNVTMIIFNEKDYKFDMIDLPELEIGGPTTSIYSKHNGLIAGVYSRALQCEWEFNTNADYEYKVDQRYADKLLMVQMKLDKGIKNAKWIKLKDKNDNAPLKESKICNLEMENKIFSFGELGAKIYDFKCFEWNNLLSKDKIAECDVFGDPPAMIANPSSPEAVLHFNEKNKNIYIAQRRDDWYYKFKFSNDTETQKPNICEYDLHENKIHNVATLDIKKPIVKIWNDETNANILYICWSSGDQLGFSYCDIRINQCYNIDNKIQYELDDIKKKYVLWAHKQQFRGFTLDSVHSISTIDIL